MAAVVAVLLEFAYFNHLELHSKYEKTTKHFLSGIVDI